VAKEGRGEMSETRIYTDEQLALFRIIRDQFEEETNSRHWTAPVSHGETAFASWKYQLWLEANITALRAEVERLRGYVQHKDDCNINKNWSEVLMAMADTPSHLRDQAWQEAVNNLYEKMAICSCGLDESKNGK
jgi:uncharacterized small protein (DUF1192 family)